MGDHTDYSGGCSLAMAIELGTTVRFAPDRRGLLEVRSEACPEPLFPTAPLASELNDGSTTAMLARLISLLDGPQPAGLVEITSTLPIGAGLSSSASLLMASALALGCEASGIELAKLCQVAESQAGSDVGLLDQMTLALARPGTALRIDFTDLDVSYVPIKETWAFTAVHTGVTRSLASAPYGERRQQCQDAARSIGPLASASLDRLAELSDPLLARRARHVISECDRVGSMIDALATDDRNGAGALMNESHRSLSVDFSVSLPAIDHMFEQIAATPGVFGARLAGGGFGGCILVLHEPQVDLDAFGDSWPALPCGPAHLLFGS
jgi:galactokinase